MMIFLTIVGYEKGTVLTEPPMMDGWMDGWMLIRHGVLFTVTSKKIRYL